MARGSYGAWSARSADLHAIRDVVVRVLEADGYHVSRRRITTDSLKVEGIRGSKALASLVNMVPVAALLGFGTRIRASVLCRPSLTAADTALRLSIRCAPVQELDSMEEQYLESQGHEERLGDNLQAERGYRRLVDALRREHLIS